MSNSIWKTPDEIPASCFLCVFDRPMGRSVGHYYPVKKQFCSGELRFEHKDIDKFCMIDDLIAQADKAERLQKAVDLAVDALDDIQMTYVVHYDNGAIRFRDAKDIAVKAKKEIKQLIKEQ